MSLRDAGATTGRTMWAGRWNFVLIAAFAWIAGLGILAILGLNMRRYFLAMSGHPPSAFVIDLSIVFAASVFGSGLMLVCREYLLARLGAEMEKTEAVLAESEAMAARIRGYGEKLRERSLS